MIKNIDQLNLLIKEKIDGFGMNLSSRIHSLKSFPRSLDIKRDDELSFGISGNKLRKIASLLPIWKKYESILALGSSSSNHVVACLQVFNEHGIDYQLWLKESHGSSSSLIRDFINLLSPKERIVSIPNSDWPRVDFMADDYQKQHDDVYVMREGA